MFLSTAIRRFSSQTVSSIVKKVNPFTKIKINGNLSYKIQPYDLFECQDSNLLRATIIDPTKSKVLDSLKINVKDNEVEIFDSHSDENTWCLLEVPIKADFFISITGDTEISNLHCDFLESQSRHIRTKDINGSEIKIQSQGAECLGLLLGQDVTINVDGNLKFNRIQGDKFFITHKNGKLHTNACYSNFSSFDCTNSFLHLKNIHKICQITGHGRGEVNMNGFYGTLLIDTEDYGLNLQLSELVDISHINNKGKRSASINLSEKVLEECFVNIQGNRAVINQNIAAMNLEMGGNVSQITINKQDLTNHLNIQHAGDTVLGKLEWADTFDFSDKIKSKIA